MDEVAQGLAAEVLGAIAARAEAVDRGVVSLAQDVDALRRAGLLARAGQTADSGWQFETLFALGGVSVPLARIFEGHLDALGLVARLGTAELVAMVGTWVGRGALLGVWGADAPDAPARTEAGAGGALRLSGAKSFASGLGIVGHALVTAADADGGTRVLMVPAGERLRHDPDAWDVVAMAGSASGRFRLDGLLVPPWCQLGAAGALFAEPHFHGGLWRICAVQAGALDALARGLDALLHARGQAADALQAGRLADVALSAQTARLWAGAAMQACAPGAAPAAVETALFAREAVEQAANIALARLERAAGAVVHGRPSALGRMMRDLRFYLRQAVPDAKLAHALALWRARAPGSGVAGAGRRRLQLQSG